MGLLVALVGALVLLGAALLYVRSRALVPPGQAERRARRDALRRLLLGHADADPACVPLASEDGRSGWTLSADGRALILAQHDGTQVRSGRLALDDVAEVTVHEDAFVVPSATRGDAPAEVLRVEVVLSSRSLDAPSVTVATLDQPERLGGDVHLAARDLARAWRARLAFTQGVRPSAPAVADDEVRRLRALAEAKRVMGRASDDELARRQRREVGA